MQSNGNLVLCLCGLFPLSFRSLLVLLVFIFNVGLLVFSLSFRGQCLQAHYIGCSSPDFRGEASSIGYSGVYACLVSHITWMGHTADEPIRLLFSLQQIVTLLKILMLMCAYREMSWKHSSFTSTLWHRITRSSYLQPTKKQQHQRANRQNKQHTVTHWTLVCVMIAGEL